VTQVNLSQNGPIPRHARIVRSPRHERSHGARRSRPSSPRPAAPRDRRARKASPTPQAPAGRRGSLSRLMGRSLVFGEGGWRARSRSAAGACEEGARIWGGCGGAWTSTVLSRAPPQPRPPSSDTCSQNGFLSSRGGCQNRWHSLVNCDHGDSTTSRCDSPRRCAATPRPRRRGRRRAPTPPARAPACR
jgi:hypothetical protein